MQGQFITFEGIDGAGKSTHVDALAALFRARGRTVLVTREPGGTPLAEKLRALVLHEDMDALGEALLVFAARRDHLLRAIQPALARGEVVLCDRFTDSTFAYQGGGHGMDLNILTTLERWVQGHDADPDAPLYQPDLTLWFDVPPRQAAQRLASARDPDRFEARDLAFFTRVSGAYAARMAQQPERFHRLDASLERDAVWDGVEQAIRARGWVA
jgi:dTMP kinase